MKSSIPLITKLSILQQGEYEWRQYEDWRQAHPQFTKKIEPKKRTPKLALLEVFAKVIGPLIREDNALFLGLQLFSFPQAIISFFIIQLSIWKLRYLQRLGLKVIAVVGSYAKTSTKYTLAHVLGGSFSVHSTKGNINRALGIAKEIFTILTSKHDFFIVELGEYNRGDIAAMTRMIAPEFVIITPITISHLERFKNPEEIEQEILDVLRISNAKAIVHNLNREVVEKQGLQDQCSFYDPNEIMDVHVSRAGTEYTVPRLSPQPFFIALFGRHNAENTLPAILLASQLRMSVESIRTQLSSLPIVPHRLEPTLLERQILVLDNGYNSNPSSATQALEVLRQLEGTLKVVCTPGFVELGKDQYTYNEKFGMQIAAVADLVLIMDGVNTKALLSGLKKKNFPESSIQIAKNEVDGMNRITSRLKPNSIILFENSIPELYQRDFS